MTTTRRRPRAATLATLVALTTSGVACTATPDPAPTPTPQQTATTPPVLRQDVAAMDAVVAELGEVLAELRTALTAAADGDQAALRTAAELLVAEVEAVTDPRPPTVLPPEPDEVEGTPPNTTDGADSDQSPGTSASPATTGDGGTAPLLPGPDASRAETVAYGDLLTRLRAAARSAGADGVPVQLFLADPLAGDLGAWQRAPGDLLALIGAAGATSSLDEALPLVLDLDGEAPRALAWVAHGLANPSDAAESASRALAHLAIIDLAYEGLR